MNITLDTISSFRIIFILLGHSTFYTISISFIFWKILEILAYANFPFIRYSRPIIYQHRHINRAKLLIQIKAPKWICHRESQLEFGPRMFCNNTGMYYISVPFICRLISKHPIFGQSRCACMVIILSLIILCTLVLAHSMEKASLLVEEKKKQIWFGTKRKNIHTRTLAQTHASTQHTIHIHIFNIEHTDTPWNR